MSDSEEGYFNISFIDDEDSDEPGSAPVDEEHKNFKKSNKFETNSEILTPPVSPENEPKLNTVSEMFNYLVKEGLKFETEEDINTTKSILKDVFIKKNNTFISGAGGTGKSYLVCNVIEKIATAKRNTIGITSTTGISALNLGGCTIHRWSGIKLGRESAMVISSEISTKNYKCLKRWLYSDFLVIDEISMLGKKTFELLSDVGSRIRKNKNPFGGLQIIVTGDFLQLSPVNDEYAFKSSYWKTMNFQVYNLTIPRRYPDVEHFHMLLRVRRGEHTKEDCKILQSRVKAYLEYIGSGQERKDEIKPTRMYSINKDVEKLNLDKLAELPGIEKVFQAYDRFYEINRLTKKPDHTKECQTLSLSEKLDYSTHMDTIVSNTVRFKVGCQVILTYNIDVDLGLVNGSRGVVVEFKDDGSLVKFTNGVTFYIRPHGFEYMDGLILVVRFQLPLTLGYATTTHKSQGLTLDKAILDLGPTLFAEGMGYVQLSRVQKLNGILLSNFIEKKIRANSEALQFEDELISKNKVGKF